MRTHRLVSLCCAMLAMATLISGAALAKSGKPSAAAQKSPRLPPLAPPSLSRTSSRGPRHSPGHLCAAHSATSSSSRRAAHSARAPLSGRTSETASSPAPAARGRRASLTTRVTTGTACVRHLGLRWTTGATGAKAPTGAREPPGTPARRVPAVHRRSPLRVPAVSVDVSLPWFTGQPYALYAHVRAITAQGPTGWSTPFEFNMRWPTCRRRSRAARVRAVEQVPGATSYQVWYPQIGKVFSAHTNVADEREFYTPSTRAGGRPCSGACAQCARSSGTSRTAFPPSPTAPGAPSTRLESRP